MIAAPHAPAPGTRILLFRAQARDGGDFTIPPPRDRDSQAPALQPTPSLRQNRPSGETAPNPFTGLARAPTGTEMVLGAAALLALAVVFLFVRQGVRAHLIDRRAALGAADGASWMLFAALMLTGTILVVATVGRLWQAWAGLVAGFSLCLILFGVALTLFLRAPERRR